MSHTELSIIARPLDLLSSSAPGVSAACSATGEEAGDGKPGDEAAAAVAEPPQTETKAEEKTKPAKPPRKSLPPWRVLLHNDDVNAMGDVVDAILDLTPLNEFQAHRVTLTAHQRGVSLILVTHRERAELFVDQFKTKLITVSCEPA